MNSLQIFNNNEFGEIQILEEKGKFEFGATEIARMLGYTNPHKAIIDHCKRDGLTKREVIDSLGRKQEKNSKKSSIRLAEKENLLYSGLDLTPKATEAICSETGLALAEIAEILLSLQLKGLAVEVGTGYYARTGKGEDCHR